jgi:hypothetical protein
MNDLGAAVGAKFPVCSASSHAAFGALKGKMKRVLIFDHNGRQPFLHEYTPSLLNCERAIDEGLKGGRGSFGRWPEGLWTLLTLAAMQSRHDARPSQSGNLLQFAMLFNL